MRHIFRTLPAAALVVLLGSAHAPAEAITDANIKLLEAGDMVRVAKIPDNIYLRSTNDPDDIIWERLPEYRVHLGPAPAVHESIELRVNYEDEGQDMFVTLARTSERFYVRLRWRDATRDLQTRSDRFRDAAAIQFSMGDDETSYIMGDGPDAPVNIWYWRSDNGKVQDLAAGGPGSTTMLENQPVSGAAQYVEHDRPEQNEWVVVMSRPLAAQDANDVSFDRGQVPIALAKWQGSEAQRDGLKSVSDGWILLDMGKE